MVNEIDGYKAPTESQSSRPLPACWMVKEIARYGGAQVQLYRSRMRLTQSILTRSASEGPTYAPSLALRVSINLDRGRYSFQSRSPSSKLEGVGRKAPG